jgi:hypothetical protein
MPTGLIQRKREPRTIPVNADTAKQCHRAGAENAEKSFSTVAISENATHPMNGCSCCEPEARVFGTHSGLVTGANRGLLLGSGLRSIFSEIVSSAT